MKKSLVVLLIVVLAVGSAFAAISGKFTGKYAIDFDKKEAGYTKGNPDFDFTLFADTKETANEGDVYAKLAVSAKFGSYTSDSVYSGGTGYNWTLVKKSVASQGSLDKQLSLSVTEASIIGADWKLDLTSTMNTANYAADAIDTYSDWSDFDEDYVSAAYGYSLKLADKTSTIAGTTFTYKGYKLSTGFNYDNIGVANKERKQAIASVETADLVFGDVTAKAFAGYSKNADVDIFAGSVKAAYADVFTAAADFGYKADKFDFDAALNIKYAPVTVDAYWATKASASLKKGNDTPLSSNEVGKLLSAKVEADLTEYAPVKLTVTGKNLLNSAATKAYARNLDVVVDTTAVADTELSVYGKSLLTDKKLGAKAIYTGVENTELTIDANYTIGKKAIGASLDAEYTADLYTATAGIAFGYETEAELSLSASIESEKLVSGATLSLAYASGDNILKAGNIGKLTTKCVIAF